VTSESVPVLSADTTVRCDKCGSEQRVSFQACLRAGWPRCHGYTMRMVDTRADVGKAMTAVLREQTVRR
jgi:phage FluMu protein Com